MYAPFAIARIRAARAGHPSMSYAEAARRFARQYPEAAIRTLDEVGCWPSSEPELRALQAVG